MLVENVSGKVGLFSCDECGKQFKRYFCQTPSDSIHFCSLKCKGLSQRAGGLLAKKTAKTNIERYGSENVFASEAIREKIKGTWLLTRGVDNPRKDPLVIAASKSTSLERYGVDNPAKSDVVKQRTLNTNMLRYGAPAHTSTESGMNKLYETNMMKYGVKTPMERQEIVDAFDYSTVVAKSHITKLNRGRFGNISIVEKELFDVLKLLYGDVRTQVIVSNRWSIDFYIVNLDTYVQLDGVYWHGLDRPLEKIAEFRSSKDRSIYKKFFRDKEQTEWFNKSGMRLVRFTDKEIRTWQKKKNLSQQLALRITTGK